MAEYQRLIDEEIYLSEILKNIDYNSANFPLYERQYCIDSFFSEGSRGNYEFIRDFMLRMGISKLYDIGCAYGYQSECFLDTGISYVGINDIKNPFWNQDRYEYCVGKYPQISVADPEDALGVTVLCLTWLCYDETGLTCDEQMAQLAKDFKHALVFVNRENLDIVKEYWQSVVKVDTNSNNEFGCFYYLKRN